MEEWGGLERQFAAFAERAARRHGARQSVVVCGGRVHRRHRRLLPNFDDWRYEDRLLGLRIGNQPAPVRRARYRWLGRHMTPDVALLWHGLESQARVVDALGPRRCLHWEHGSAWHSSNEHATRAVLEHLPAVLCNTHAAKRMLELKWGYEGRVRVCHDGVRVSHQPRDFKYLPHDRPLHIGLVGALIPARAPSVALHTLAALKARHIDATLSIAGDGPLKPALEEQARALGIESAVHFLGTVEDMALFYSDIDILLNPSIHEPLPVTAAQAGSFGCPVVCTAVDGLPEVVADGHTGLCVAPQEDLARYQELGGVSEGLPSAVYGPQADCLQTPAICEPEAFADAIESIVQDAERYARMSHAGIERAGSQFEFNRQVDRAMQFLGEYHERGTFERAA
ncbi:glycosyltransferase [Endozoicomonas sp. G2_2]|uniref:glycosyltransferase n=1 Tax=Endozoicomonas sp. G2_2 TaxID=2821092 RepID=UPI001ADAEAB9|nr:glycosyltransferase [Endozoicomonas sp. G2_2]MBO9469651.1 glycosyltransferase [Endozoicomonas sp. G2_2]